MTKNTEGVLPIVGITPSVFSHTYEALSTNPMKNTTLDSASSTLNRVPSKPLFHHPNFVLFLKKSITKSFFQTMKNLLLCVLCCVFTRLFAQNETADHSLSPYFLVKTATPNVDALPLKSTIADVKIAGTIADVTVRQTYQNKGSQPLECIYVFPASTRAAVYAMQMKVGKRIINARIREKQQARREYEAAKSEGKRTSLLEQDRPNVFQMNVANILPNDVVEVTLQYTEMIVPTEGVYQFVYPTTVGPRYNNPQNTGKNNAFAATPYLKKGEATPFVFDIQVHVNSGVPIQNIHSKTHWIDVSQSDYYHAVAKLKNEDGGRGNKDFVLNYQLKGEHFQSGVMLYEHKDENFFLAMIQPPKTVKNDQIPPREYIFIVDVSGSMNGFPLNVSKKLMRNLINNLRKSDFFNVMLFSGGNSVLSEKSLPATDENIQKAIQLIDYQQGGGGTELLPAMRRALALPRTEKGLSRSMILVTDGYITVEKESFELIRNNLNQCNVFAFGIGSGVNRYLMEGLAHVGQGEPFIIENDSAADAQAEKFRKYINTPVLSQIKYKMEGFNAYDIEPLNVPDVMAERPIILFGKYKGKPSGSIVIEGYSGRKLIKQTINVGQNVADAQNSALRYLWAREKLRYLDDFNQDNSDDSTHIQQVVDLGLKYNLLTAHTSFVAVDETPVVDENGKLVTVKQPSALPEGVENTAVGADFSFEEVFEMGSRLPSFMWLGFVLAAAVVFIFTRKMF
ncbi:MAG: VWA domain-containing protein [Saprospiraceae bacterium]|nr:VWA domain-containing protein [Saprospiraceae bacterium]